MTPLGKKESEQTNEDSDAESAASDGETSWKIIKVMNFNQSYFVFVDQESSASEDHESEDDNDGRESFTVNY